MPRPFSIADRVQFNSGATQTADLTVSLPGAAQVQNAVICFLMGFATYDPFLIWHLAASGPTSDAAVNNPKAGILCRTDLSSGESSWNFPIAGGTVAWVLWRVEEWTNISPGCPIAGRDDVNQIISPTTVNFSADLLGGLTPAYNVAYAAVGLVGSASGSAWSSGGSWTNGFEEIHLQEVGTGASGSDVQLRIARKFGGADETGPWTTSFTYGGAETNKIAYGAMAVFRAQNYQGDI